MDADGRRHLLVQLQPDEEGLHDSHSRGITVATRELNGREQ
jgi:hypothetical protein